MKISKIFAILALFVLTALESYAGGFVVVAPPGGGSIAPRRLPTYLLECKSLKVNVEIEGRYARTSIDQVFSNPSNRRLEGHFIFPTPKGATLKDFSMDINGKQMSAELLDATKARKIYEEIVRRALDPALLEYSEQSMFRVRIFPIEPRSEKRIKISYTELLESENNTNEYIFPLSAKKYSGKPLREVMIKVDVKSDSPIKTLYSPTHEVETIRKNDKTATVAYEAREIKPEHNFKLYLGYDRAKIGVSMLSHKPEDDNGYFFLDISPGFAKESDEIVNKDITFVLDVSGSMAGEKLEQAKKALNFCINNLNERDRFEIIKFSTEAQAVFNKRMAVNTANIKKAKKFVKKLKAIGGTNIGEALALALKEKADAGRPNMIIFLTDGKPTIGETEENKLVAEISKNNEENTKIFTFGIGFDINTHLLDKITEKTKAYRSYITPEEDIEIKVSNFYSKVSSPVLTEIKLSIDGARIEKVFPKEMPDLFKGSSINVMGRYDNSGKARIRLEGKVNGKTEKFEFEAELSGSSDKYDFIPPLWATRNIGYLLDQIRLHGEEKELVDEVTALAKKYGVITPYTSYLILEDERIDISRRRLPPERIIFNNRAMDDEGFRSSNAFEYDAMKRKSGGASVQASEEVQSLNNIANQMQIVADSTTLIYKDKNGVTQNFANQVRNIQGRAVYQNGTEWIDLYVQNSKVAKTNKIQFAGKEYFKLLNNEPQVAQFLSLGKNVRFIYNNELYEIYE